MEALFRLLPGPQPIIVRYGATVALVMFAFALRMMVAEATGQYGFLLFILPVVVSGLLFDRGTGFFATALSAALVAAILPWQGKAQAHVGAILTFVIVAGCLVFIAEGLHRALEAAHKAQRAADLLLQEMTHRVKNKFAMVSSIIGLQARQSSDEVRAVLEDIVSRVNIIATVHNYLQLSRHDGLIDMSEYLPELCKSLQGALCGPRPISLTTTAAQIELPPDKALSTGLIVNELVTNAFKYAFPDERPGHIRVELAETNGDVTLSVTDDGKGCEPEKQAGLGTRLVTVFATQLGGGAAWEACPDGGCKATVHFPA
jgi:two-component sensor histidine kinase